MRRVAANRVIAAVSIALLGALASAAQNIDSAFQFEPSVSVNVDLTRKFRFEFLAGQEDSDDLSRNRWRARVGVSFRLKPLFRGMIRDPEDDKRYFLVLKAGYERSQTKFSETTEFEDRFTLEITPRHRWPSKILTSDRNRFEFRWINGVYSFRYRNRPRLERELNVAGFRFTPYVSAEAYWDQRFGKLNQVKFTTGSDIPLGSALSIDSYYERRNCTTCTARHTNVIGITLNLYLQLKR